MTQDTEQSALPVISDNALEGRLGEGAVDLAVTKMGFIFHNQTGADYGVDGTIEVARADGTGKRVATGRQIAVQIKRGNHVVKRTHYGYTLYCTQSHANYWLGHSLPVIAVYSHPQTDHLHWAHITESSLRQTPKGFAVDIAEASDLTLAAAELRKLADTGKTNGPARRAVLLLPFDENEGITTSDEELGLTCLEFAKAASRGVAPSIEIEVIGQARLVASIDAIHDLAAPTADQRRGALVRGTILDRYERKAAQLKRALTWFLTDPKLSRFIGLNDEQLARAVRCLASYFVLHHLQLREPGSTALVAWPAADRHAPSVTFDVSQAQIDQLYAGSEMTRMLIRMGDAGGVMTSEMGDEAFTTRFLPALVRYLMTYADNTQMPDEDVLDSIGVELDQWRLGLS